MSGNRTTSAFAPAPAELTLPDAPAIPGLRFRRFRDASDWAALAELHRAAAMADEDDDIPTPEILQITLEHKAGFQLGRDLLLAEVDGQVVAEATGSASIRDGYPVHSLNGRVHPEWRRRGIGRALFHWNERRARERAVAEPKFASGSAVLGAWASEFEPGARALYESEGYRVIRYAFTMIHRHVRDAEPIPMPEGIELRPVTPDQHRAIFEADDEAFRDHFEHRAFTEEDFVATFLLPELDTSLWMVGWDGDQVAGSVQTWIWPAENEALGVKRAWLESVSVRRPWRRRGLAQGADRGVAGRSAAARDRGGAARCRRREPEWRAGPVRGSAVSRSRSARCAIARRSKPELPGLRFDGPVGRARISRASEATMTETTFRLSSTAFQEGGEIPTRFTCDDEDVSPDLTWEGAPPDTGALALVVDDPDARGWVHWVVFDMTGTASGGLAEGIATSPDAPPQGTNDFGRLGWGGPCPPSGEHRYAFRLLALDGPLA